MSKVRDLISDALKSLGVLAAGENIEAGDAQDALVSLNDMLETWNNDNLKVYSINRQVFPLTVGVQDYTLGTGGTFNIPRPNWIQNVSIIPDASAPTLEIPIDMLRDEQWRNVAVKSLTSTFPTLVYPHGDFPLNTLSFWPAPSAACSAVLYTPVHVSAFATINDTVSFPNGYREALRFGLALRLAPNYGIEPSATIVSLAMNALNWIRKVNWTPDELTVDNALLGKRGTSRADRSFGYVVD